MIVIVNHLFQSTSYFSGTIHHISNNLIVLAVYRYLLRRSTYATTYHEVSDSIPGPGQIVYRAVVGWSLLRLVAVVEIDLEYIIIINMAINAKVNIFLCVLATQLMPI